VKNFCIAGVDLAGAASRPTGCCILQGLKASTSIVFSDQEILSSVKEAKADLVAIDAPLSLPPGRRSIEDRKGSHFRPSDQELRSRKIPFFPLTLGPMRSLTERGISLCRKLEVEGWPVIEVYPGGAQDIWGIPRAKRDLEGLREGLRRLGIRGLKKVITGHELDAATAAFVGFLFLLGKAEVFGDFSSGAIVMPSSRKLSP